jgi:hypothetical protein
MVPIEQKDWTEEDRASKLDQNHPLDSAKRHFLEVVKARAATALCKSGTERERDLGRFDVDVVHANEAIAARCL